MGVLNIHLLTFGNKVKIVLVCTRCKLWYARHETKIPTAAGAIVDSSEFAINAELRLSLSGPTQCHALFFE